MFIHLKATIYISFRNVKEEKKNPAIQATSFEPEVWWESCTFGYLHVTLKFFIIRTLQFFNFRLKAKEEKTKSQWRCAK